MSMQSMNQSPEINTERVLRRKCLFCVCSHRTATATTPTRAYRTPARCTSPGRARVRPPAGRRRARRPPTWQMRATCRTLRINVDELKDYHIRPRYLFGLSRCWIGDDDVWRQLSDYLSLNMEGTVSDVGVDTLLHHRMAVPLSTRANDHDGTCRVNRFPICFFYRPKHAAFLLFWTIFCATKHIIWAFHFLWSNFTKINNNSVGVRRTSLTNRLTDHFFKFSPY